MKVFWKILALYVSVDVSCKNSAVNVDAWKSFATCVDCDWVCKTSATVCVSDWFVGGGGGGGGAAAAIVCVSDWFVGGAATVCVSDWYVGGAAWVWFDVAVCAISNNVIWSFIIVKVSWKNALWASKQLNSFFNSLIVLSLFKSSFRNSGIVCFDGGGYSVFETASMN